MSDKFTAEVKYVGSEMYSYYQWRAAVFCNDIEVANESSDWRWWLFIWVRVAAIQYRSKQRRERRNRNRGSKSFEL